MYKVSENLKGRTAYTSKGAINLDKASQKELKYLYELGYNGVTKSEKS